MTHWQVVHDIVDEKAVTWKSLHWFNDGRAQPLFTSLLYSLREAGLLLEEACDYLRKLLAGADIILIAVRETWKPLKKCFCKGESTGRIFWSSSSAILGSSKIVLGLFEVLHSLLFCLV